MLLSRPKNGYIIHTFKWIRKTIALLSKKQHFISRLEKKDRFAVQTITMTAGLVATQLVWEDVRFIMVFVLSVLGYFLTAWSLKEDINGIEWLYLFILPVSFIASVSLFYFLLPERMITRLIITLVFAVGCYAILRIENIYNVAAIRTIALLRAAQTVGLLITLVVVYLTLSIIITLKLSSYLNIAAISPVIFLLSLQSLWSVNLELSLRGRLLLYSLAVTLVIAEVVYAFSFWPVTVSSLSLLVASFYYSLVGIIQHYFSDRLFKDVYREYILVIIFTVIMVFFTSRWSG